VPFSPVLIIIVVLAFYLLSSIKVLNEYERAVVFRLGKLLAEPKGPGVIFVFAPIDKMVRVSLRTVVMDVPPQDVITRDNVSVKVNAVLYFRVVDPQRAIIQVENFLMATSQLAQTTLRAVLGKHELDEMLAERERLNVDIQQILDAQTQDWGIKVTNVEIKHVDLNETMVRAIARQAEAERERRAKVIHAEGEKQAAAALLEAAQMLAKQPEAMQLRYLQTMTQVAGHGKPSRAGHEEGRLGEDRRSGLAQQDRHARVDQVGQPVVVRVRMRDYQRPKRAVSLCPQSRHVGQ